MLVEKMNKLLLLVLAFCVVTAVLATPALEAGQEVGGDWELCKKMRRCERRIPCCESVEGPNCCEKPDPWRFRALPEENVDEN